MDNNYSRQQRDYSKEIKRLGIGLGVAFGTILLFVFIAWLSVVSFGNKAADFETQIQMQVSDCAQEKTAGINALIMLADVDQNTKDYLVELVNGKVLEDNQELRTAYDDVVSGNPAQFMFLMSGIAGTNFTVTAENLQHQIMSYTESIKLCSRSLLMYQRSYRKHLGMNAAGEITKFPNTFYVGFFEYPTMLNDDSVSDTDNDGIITVLDYKPPVSAKVEQEFKTGTDSGPIDLNP